MLEHFGYKIIFTREKNTYIPNLYKKSAELKIEEVSVSHSDVLYLEQVREEERFPSWMVGLNEQKHFKFSRIPEYAISRTKKLFNHLTLIYLAT